MLLSQSGSDVKQIQHVYWGCATADRQEQSLSGQYFLASLDPM